MGYLTELQQELRALLGEMEEAQQKKIARFVGAKILESYRNGLLAAKLVKVAKEAEHVARRVNRPESGEEREAQGDTTRHPDGH
jgi:hypothetical protein